MTNGDKEESSQTPAVNSSFGFSSASIFLLIPGPYGRLDDVLFDYGEDYMPLYDYVNDIFSLLVNLILNITHWRGIFNTFELVVCWLDAHIFFVCNVTNTKKYF